MSEVPFPELELTSVVLGQPKLLQNTHCQRLIIILRGNEALHTIEHFRGLSFSLSEDLSLPEVYVCNEMNPI